MSAFRSADGKQAMRGIPPREMEHFRRTVRAITVHRPMSWAIIYGGKCIENRPYRKPPQVRFLLIHAGATYSKTFEASIREQRRGKPLPPNQSHATGIIGVVRVWDAATSYDEAVSVVGIDGAQWFSGPHGWVLSHPVRLQPIEHRGYQRLWKPSAEAMDNVCKQISESEDGHEMVAARFMPQAVEIQGPANERTSGV